MSSQVNPGLGTTISVGGSVVAQVVSIDGPGISMGTVETTNLSSTAKTYRYTLLDMGELSFEIQYDPATTTHTALQTLLTTPAATTCVITFSDTHTITFSGILTGFSPGGIEAEGNLTASIKIKGTGLPTFA